MKKEINGIKISYKILLSFNKLSLIIIKKSYVLNKKNRIYLNEKINEIEIGEIINE